MNESLPDIGSQYYKPTVNYADYKSLIKKKENRTMQCFIQPDICSENIYPEHKTPSDWNFELAKIII